MVTGDSSPGRTRPGTLEDEVGGGSPGPWGLGVAASLHHSSRMTDEGRKYGLISSIEEPRDGSYSSNLGSHHVEKWGRDLTEVNGGQKG